MNQSSSSKTAFFKFMFGPVLSVVAACLMILISPDAPGADPEPAQKNGSESFGDEARLPGVFYDMKQTSDGMPTYLMGAQDGKQFNRLRTWQSVWNLPDTAGKESVLVPFLKRFVLSNWPYRTDSAGNLFFREFANFSRSPVTPYRSFFYQPFLSSGTAPKTFSGNPDVPADAGWVGIYAGYVLAPFTGKFRFVGYGDDALVVRFDSQLVLDYGCYALSLGKKLDDTWEYFAILSGAAARTDPQKRPVLDNPIYSKCKLETYSPSLFDDHGLAKGVPVSVVKGRAYPIEILVSDIESNQFGMALFVEYLDPDGKPLKENPSKLPLFRTASELPGHPSGGSFPDFEEDGPIWSVVDSRGKPIPSHKPAAAVADRKKDSDSADKTQPAKNVSTSTQTRGNTSIRTVTEHRGDTMIETVTTTETNGDTTVQTSVTTETKNGVVLKKTTSTSKTVVVELFPDEPPPAGQSPREPERTDAGTSDATTASPPTSTPTTTSTSEKNAEPSSTKKNRNPFGYTQPLPEDD